MFGNLYFYCSKKKLFKNIMCPLAHLHILLWAKYGDEIKSWFLKASRKMLFISKCLLK